MEREIRGKLPYMRTRGRVLLDNVDPSNGMQLFFFYLILQNFQTLHVVQTIYCPILASAGGVCR
ncbi:hypothetical protein I7I53_03953 [Histoplasma capsulatum var. duboisii H88]|uniref:Uncharacterized protein n=1 Tax=Ajellomyces capsulatus (strain H88) TaxID=544711 RepID=A0A8A1LPS1_AJEC8|nr:hypothetical protein I7I53_03953 [Histoplasma capsulatum var. duboisii H88]